MVKTPLLHMFRKPSSSAMINNNNATSHGQTVDLTTAKLNDLYGGGNIPLLDGSEKFRWFSKGHMHDNTSAPRPALNTGVTNNGIYSMATTVILSPVAHRRVSSTFREAAVVAEACGTAQQPDSLVSVQMATNRLAMGIYCHRRNASGQIAAAAGDPLRSLHALLHRTFACRMCFHYLCSLTHFVPPPCWAYRQIRAGRGGAGCGAAGPGRSGGRLPRQRHLSRPQGTAARRRRKYLSLGRILFLFVYR